MFKEKIRSVDWQRVADWCVHLFWRNSGWVLILIVFAPVGLTHVLERFNQTLLPIVIWAVLIGLAGFVAMGIFGMLLALFYIVQFKYRYSKSTPFKILVTCLVLGGLASIAMSETKQRAISVYQWQFIGTSKAIFEQLNANRQSTQAADTQIKQLIEKYNSSNNTLKVTRIITHPTHIYSTTSDREGLGNPVVQFQLRHHTDSTLFWRCQVVRAGSIAPSKFAWCI